MAAKAKNKSRPQPAKPARPAVKTAKLAPKPAIATKPAGAAKPKPAAPADLARAFQLELQSVPAPPPSSVITLDPDVAPHFPNSRAVNEALRALIRIVRQVRAT